MSRPTLSCRWLLLGGGPLRRTTDRLHALSRIVVLAALLAAVPVGIVVGLALTSALHRTADAEAAARSARTATLLSDAGVATSPEDGDVLASAEWAGLHGRAVTGQVLAPGGAAAGSTVTVWLDRAGRITSPPLADRDIAAEGITAGVVAGLGLPVVAGLAHLLAVSLLDRARLRRWGAEWLTVEPLWAGRIR
jgi:hypothetical protein